MAGETVKTEAICLDVRPWSQTSHIVTWLTPQGRLATVVRGAARPKSWFLGQYDLNYTCEILYYARARGEVHALRECRPLDLRERLRGDYRALALAGYFRRIAAELAPPGCDCGPWYRLLASALSGLPRRSESAAPRSPDGALLGALLAYELAVLRLSGLAPDFSGYDRSAAWSEFSLETGSFAPARGRCLRLSRAVAAYLCRPQGKTENLQTPLDAARVIGVFYQLHLDCAVDVRRAVLGLISG